MKKEIYLLSFFHKKILKFKKKTIEFIMEI